MNRPKIASGRLAQFNGRGGGKARIRRQRRHRAARMARR